MTKLLCPSAADVASTLASGALSAAEAIRDILEVAEAAGATSVDLVVDSRRHGTNSLLAPGLARAQGAALCVNIPGDCCLFHLIVYIVQAYPAPHRRLLQGWLSSGCHSECQHTRQAIPNSLYYYHSTTVSLQQFRYISPNHIPASRIAPGLARAL